MSEPRIVDRGDGPKIEGTRITVHTVLEYLRMARTRDWIAALLNLSSRQVQAAMDYIRDHEAELNAEYDKILARIGSRSGGIGFQPVGTSGRQAGSLSHEMLHGRSAHGRS